MKVIVHNLRSFDQNEVASLEIIIPKSKNNADFINDVLIPKIFATGFRAIGSGGRPEIAWAKNQKGENVLNYFGATEGRTTISQVVAELKVI